MRGRASAGCIKRQCVCMHGLVGSKHNENTLLRTPHRLSAKTEQPPTLSASPRWRTTSRHVAIFVSGERPYLVESSREMDEGHARAPCLLINLCLFSRVCAATHFSLSCAT